MKRWSVEGLNLYIQVKELPTAVSYGELAHGRTGAASRLHRGAAGYNIYRTGRSRFTLRMT